ncbi:MAG: M20/M25/M40 family metallo-hydrolase, partial [candidate division Zixibacteria bacterium]|nr:M20/M25/M40 family metallo-hydrolase [candidate division Zixibacteria bacterium]
MFYGKRWVVCYVVLIVLFFIGNTQASDQYLINIQLKTPEDYQIAADLGLKAYIKLDNAYITEIDKEKIQILEINNLTFQIIDETPWIQDYYLVSKTKSRTKVNLSDHGEVLFEDEKGALLKIDRDKALKLLEAGYQLNRVYRNRTIPLKYKPPPSPSIPVVSFSQDLDSLVNQVSMDSLTSYVEKLQSYNTRFVYSDSIPKARHWLLNKFEDFGIDSVYFYPFTGYDSYLKWDWFNDSNVVAVIPGTVNPDKVIVVGGHYDSVNWDEAPYDFNAPAPGADDNGSGTAATLEIARILAEHPLSKTVIFMPFAAEEIGLHGSWAYAQDAAYQGIDIQLMINFDMIAEEANSTDMLIHTDPPSQSYAQLLSQMAGLYTSLTPHIAGNSSGSDSWPFSQLGYNIVYSDEYIFSSQYHKASDSLTHMDIPYMSEIVKMNLATVVEVASSPGPVEDVRVWDAGDGEKLYVNWSSLEENDLVEYRLYFGTESGVYTDTHTVLSGYTSDTLRNLQNEVPYYIA